uniref:Uncharacterized protein n=1 Tax=viral metagenome TaxID=1070528 RepID=A0A6C0DIJ0_9ZZZZ
MNYMELLEIGDVNDFHNKWGNIDFSNDTNIDFVISKWKAIHVLFYDYNDVISKSKNIWFNEIREIGLYNLFFTDPTYFSQYFSDEPSDILNQLLSLQEKWIGIIFECADEVCNGDNDYKLLSFVKKGGQTTSHDFELNIRHNGVEQIVKIEFKFSSSSKDKITQLAEFAAINTESASGLLLFGSSYLDFFWPVSYERNFIQEMCNAVNIQLPRDRESWKKIAKSVAVPKNGAARDFHLRLRQSDIMKNDGKKKIVNESFDVFITQKLDFIRDNLSEISNIFNTKQEDKFFCIFSSGTFKKDTIPLIQLNDVVKVGEHTFELITTTDNNIRCDMSWGNGGAGNQNPRVLFKLSSKPAARKGGYKKRGGKINGGDGHDYDDDDDHDYDDDDDHDYDDDDDHDYDDDDYDWFDTHEELAIDDIAGIDELEEIQGDSDKIVEIKDVNEPQQEILNTMKLRSGKIYNIPNQVKKGGNYKHHTKKISKNTKIKKTRKTRKTKKTRKTRSSKKTRKARKLRK